MPWAQIAEHSGSSVADFSSLVGHFDRSVAEISFFVYSYSWISSANLAFDYCPDAGFGLSSSGCYHVLDPIDCFQSFADWALVSSLSGVYLCQAPSAEEGLISRFLDSQVRRFSRATHPTRQLEAVLSALSGTTSRTQA